MQSIRQHKAPHVVAGMHYKLERFKELYSWINALQMDSSHSAMPPYGFGLLAFENPLTDFQLSLEGHQLQLTSCCGITKNGSIIGVFEGVNAPMKTDLKLEKEGCYIIMLVVDNQTRTAIGQADNTENTLRQPFSIPSYHFDIFLEETKDIAAFKNALLIGSLKKEGTEIRLLTDAFLPTVKHVGASDFLYKKFLGYQKTFDNFLVSLIQIAKITERKLEHEIIDLRSLSLQLGNYIATNKWIFDLGEKATPLQLFNFCKSFAVVLDFHFSTLNQQTPLLRLIKKNVEARIGRGSEFTPQAFKNVIEDLTNSQYNHYRLVGLLDTIDHFIKVIYTHSFELLGKNDKIFTIKEGMEFNPDESTPKSKNGGSWF